MTESEKATPQPVIASEPTLSQYQNYNGGWSDFIDENHYLDTVADGKCRVRSLYAAPQQVIAPPQSDITELLARLQAAEADAAKLRWLLENNCDWSWQPTRFNAEIISGFTHKSTSYLGYQFSDSVDAARAKGEA
jgi:hypothetical protein